MKKILSSILIAGLAGSLMVGCQQEGTKAEKTELLTKHEKVSYSLGLDIGKSLKNLNYDVDMDIFMQGINNTIKDQKLLLTEEEVKAVMTEWSQEQREAAKKKSELDAKKNEEEGRLFLEKNKTTKDIKITESGLQYKIITEGKGASPSDSDKVEIHYTGKTIAGKVFDSSIERGKPVTMPLSRSIPGWKEGLKLMKEGGKAELYIPANLAYGPRQAGPDIGPNSTLIFEVELLKINPEPQAPKMPTVMPTTKPVAKPSAEVKK